MSSDTSLSYYNFQKPPFKNPRSAIGVSCGQIQPVQVCDREVCILKILFSRICSLVVPDQKLTIFALETPSGWDTSCIQFELNLSSRH